MSFVNLNASISTIDLDDDTLTAEIQVTVPPGTVAAGRSITVPMGAGATIQSMTVVRTDGAGLRGARALSIAPVNDLCSSDGTRCLLPELQGELTITFVFRLESDIDAPFRLSWLGEATAVSLLVPAPDRRVSITVDPAVGPLPAGVPTEVTLGLKPAAGNAALRSISLAKQSPDFILSGCPEILPTGRLSCAVKKDGNNWSATVTATPVQPTGDDQASLSFRYGSRTSSVELSVTPLVTRLVGAGQILAGAGTTMTVTAGWTATSAVTAPVAITVPRSIAGGEVTVTDRPNCIASDDTVSCPAVPVEGGLTHRAIFTVFATGAVGDVVSVPATVGTATAAVGLTVVRPTVTLDAEPIPAGLSGQVTVIGRWATEQPVILRADNRVAIPRSPATGVRVRADNCGTNVDTLDCAAVIGDDDASVTTEVDLETAGSAAGAVGVPVLVNGSRAAGRLPTVEVAASMVDVLGTPTFRAAGSTTITIHAGWNIDDVVVVGRISVPRTIDGVLISGTPGTCISDAATISCEATPSGRAGSFFEATFSVAALPDAVDAAIPLAFTIDGVLIAASTFGLAMKDRADPDVITLTGGGFATGLSSGRNGTACTSDTGPPSSDRPISCARIPTDADPVWAEMTWSVARTPGAPPGSAVSTATVTTGVGSFTITATAVSDARMDYFSAGLTSDQLAKLYRSRTGDAVLVPLVTSVGYPSAAQDTGWTLTTIWRPSATSTRTDSAPVQAASADLSVDRHAAAEPIIYLQDSTVALFDLDRSTSTTSNWELLQGARFIGQIAITDGARSFVKNNGSGTIQPCGPQCASPGKISLGILVGPRVLTTAADLVALPASR